MCLDGSYDIGELQMEGTRVCVLTLSLSTSTKPNREPKAQHQVIEN